MGAGLVYYGNMVIRRNDLSGLKFGRWTVLTFSHLGKNWTAHWKVRCECGAIGKISAGTLVSGASKSCGCLARDKCIETHTTHGMVDSSEYSSWEHMKARCLNKKHKHYKYYGGRGIKICKKWLKFSNFFKDMGSKPSPKHTLDRIESNRNYQKDNCRWATRKEQSRNTAQNVNFMWQGKLRCLSEIASMYNISRQTLVGRLNYGWPLDRAISEPIRKRA